MNLTTAQEQAIFHKDGPALVLAGPGSGKTFVITQRIRTLIKEHMVNPEQILVITFTRAAALEMKERFLKLTGTCTTRVSFGTFHSIFFHILRNSYTYPKDCIISEKEKNLLLRRIAKKFLPEEEDSEDFIELFFKEMQKKEAAEDFSREEYSCIYQSYVNRLKTDKRLDFEQILTQCHFLLANHPDILAYWQKRYSYILIDEFQDINSIQFKTVQLLAAKSRNLFVVGDDDQAIYGFRGSRPDIMLDFPNVYTECQQILLDKNFRCGRTIVEHSVRLISNNEVRFDKIISPFRTEEGRIFINKFETVKKECGFIISSVRDGIADGLSYKDMAILFRVHSGTGNLMTALHKANIPFMLKDKIPDIFEHWICQDLLSYMKVARKKGSRLDFIRILDKPFKGIYRSDLKSVWNPENLKENFHIPENKRRAGFEDFLEKMAYLSTLPPALAVSYIEKALGYQKFLKDYAIKQDILYEDLNGILENFKDAAVQTGSLEELLDTIEAFREGSKTNPPEDFDGVCLMSFHGSKGLEFKRVYLTDCNEEITPYKKAVEKEEIEEERRMFYVAATRAKDELYLCFLERMYNKKLAVSRFVEEFANEKKTDAT